MTDISTLLNNFAFPIVAFLITVYALKYTYDKSLEQQSRYADQISNLAEAVNNNTKVLTELVAEMRK